jgi:hypothetical protein
VPVPFLKGMTVSCQTWGYEWATPEMKETMIGEKLSLRSEKYIAEN